MEENTIIDRNQMKAYILNKFRNEGDFSFLKDDELEDMVDTMLDLDAAYAQSIGEDVYDDDDAYDALYDALQKKYPDYKMYCMRLAEDYLDFSEEYLVSIDAIEWE